MARVVGILGVVAAVVGCSFNEAGLPQVGGDAAMPGSPDARPADAAVPPPDAAPASPDAPPGTPDATPTADAPCPPVILEARKSYQPPTWYPDLRDYTPDTIAFAIPGTLDVNDGNAANHCAFLEWSVGADRIECAYKGGASVTHVDGDPTQTALGLTYHFLECRTGQVRMFPACGGGNAGTVSGDGAGHATSAALISFTVNGDSHEGTTEATAVLAGSCDPDA